MPGKKSVDSEKSTRRPGFDAFRMIYCKLFSDLVTDHLCELRRAELQERNGFTCTGCYSEIDVSQLLLEAEKKRGRTKRGA